MEFYFAINMADVNGNINCTNCCKYCFSVDDGDLPLIIKVVVLTVPVIIIIATIIFI